MTREYHYWIVAEEPDSGKPYLIYGCPQRNGEDQARQKGLETLNGLDFKLVTYPTRDLSRASSFLRGKRLSEGKGLKESARRQGHEGTIKRRSHRKRWMM